MKRLTAPVLVLVVILSCLLCSHVWAQQAQQQVVSPTSPDDASLITPISARPIPIDEALKRRLAIVGEPARNLILVLPIGMNSSMLNLQRLLGDKRSRLAVDQFSVIGRTPTLGFEHSLPPESEILAKLACGERVRGSGHVESPVTDSPGSVNLFREMQRQERRLGLIVDGELADSPGLALFGCSLGQGSSSERLRSLCHAEPDFLLGQTDVDADELQHGQASSPNASAGARLHKPVTLIRQQADWVEALRGDAPRLYGFFPRSSTPFTIGEEPISNHVEQAIKYLQRTNGGYVLVITFSELEQACRRGDVAGVLAFLERFDDLLKRLLMHCQGRTDTLMVLLPGYSLPGWTVNAAFSRADFREKAGAYARILPLLTGTSPATAALPPELATLGFSSEDWTSLLAITEESQRVRRFGELLYGKLGVEQCSNPRARSLEDYLVWAHGTHEQLFSGTLKLADVTRALAAALGLAFP